jgi:hypothetical protein
MKNFKVTIITDVFVDSFEDGELNQVNSFMNSYVIQEETPLKAIQEVFTNKMFYSFDEKHAYIDEENEKTLFYSHLVDDDYNEVLHSEEKHKRWKKGKEKLFSANHEVRVRELTTSKIY